MKTYHRTLLGLILAMALMLTSLGSPEAGSDAALMTKEELKAVLDDPDLVILDVRTGKDWTSSEFKIQGARYVEAKAYDDWAGTYPKSKKFVLYCA